jgi:hypothetical protein
VCFGNEEPLDDEAVSKQDSNTTLIGRWANGPCHSVEVIGDTAYFANGGYLEIADFSDPENPVRIGKILMPPISTVNKVLVEGNYAYVEIADKIYVIDVSDPINPSNVGVFEMEYSCKDISVKGEYLYIASDTSCLRIIDVSDPSKINEIGFFKSKNPEEIYSSLDVNDSCAYIIHTYHTGRYDEDIYDGLKIIDISKPSDPSLASQYVMNDYTIGIEGFDIEINNDYAYIDISSIYGNYGDDVEYHYSSGIQIIDISKPSNPVMISELLYKTNHKSEYLAVNQEYAYLYHEGEVNLKIIDISDPLNPSEIKEYNINGSNNYPFNKDYDIKATKDQVYIADSYKGLKIIDVSNHSDPSLAGQYETNGSVRGVEIYGNYAYIANAFGVEENKIIDISNPSNLKEINWNYHCNYNEIKENYLYGLGDSLKIIDISDPENPVKAGSYDINGYRNYKIKDHYIYLTKRTSEGSILKILNISNPDDIFEAGACLLKNKTTSLAVSKEYAFVGQEKCSLWPYTCDFWLSIINISDPSEPELIKTQTTYAIEDNYSQQYSLNEMIIRDQNAYVLYGPIIRNDSWIRTAGFKMLDISDPLNISTSGIETIGFDDNVHHMALENNFLYISGTNYGLNIIDVSDTANVAKIGSCYSQGGYEINAEEGYAYLAGGDEGLFIIKNNLAFNTVFFNIINETGEAIEDATIKIDTAELSTNASGEAKIELINGDYDYTVTAEGYNDVSGTVSVDGENVNKTVELTASSTSVKDIDANNSLEIYPNPTAGLITVETGKTCNIRLLNVIGNVIYTGKINSINNKIDMSQYQPGVYFIQLEKNGRTINKRILLK